MAEGNPIKYSDLIVADDSIDKLIEKLEALNKTFTDLAGNVKAEAASMVQSLKTVSGATEQGRQATRGATEDADRLAKAQRALEFAQSETAKQVALLKEQQRQAAMMNKLEAQQKVSQTKLTDKLGQSYNTLSAQYRINKIALNNLTAEERANDAAAKKLEEETKAIYEQMKKLQEATGKYSLNVGNYENAIQNALGANNKWFQSLQQIKGLFEGGLTTGIKTAGTAVAGFGRQLLALLANPIVATIAAVTAAFMALANGISSSEQNTMALERVLAPFQRILTGVVNVLQMAATGVLKVVEGFENLAMGASRLMEKLPLVGGAFKKVNDALAENIELTRRKQMLDMAERSNSVEQARLAKEAARVRNLAAQTTDPQRQAMLLANAKATEHKIMLNEIELAKEDLAIKQKIADMADNDKEANDALAAAKVRLYKAEENYYQRTLRMEKQLTRLNTSSGSGGGKSGRSTAVDNADREAKEKERILKESQKKELAAIRQAEDAKVALKENSFDRERAETILSYDRHIEDLKAQLAEEANLTEEAKKAMNDTIIALEQQKWNKLADIADKEMKQAVDAETRDAQERSKKAEQMAKQQNETLKKRKDLYDILGFKLTDDQKKGIDEALGYAIGSLNQFMDAYVAAAEARRQEADNEVERTQRVLEAEIEARNAGYANDVETARKELEEAKKNQQKAIEQQKRAQQAQELIDTATQTSSLITATANIWKSLSGIPIVGTALAIAAIATMWGSFAAAKIMAHQVAGSSTESYGEGTVELLQGGSHQSGNDIDLGRKKDGTRRRAEGGEYFAVINKRSSKKYGNIIPDIINSLNRDTFAEKYMGAYDGAGVSVTVNGRNPDLKELTQSVNDIRDQGRTRTYMDGGNTVMVYKNLKRVVRNGN